MWRQALILLLGMLLGLSGCVKVSACFDAPEECPLMVAVEAGSLTYARGGELDAQVSGASGLMPLTATLTQRGSAAVSEVRVSGLSGADSLHLWVAPDAVKPFTAGLLELTLFEGMRSGTTHIPLNAEVLSATPVVASGISSSVERLGFSGGKLLSLRSYSELMAAKKRFLQYSTSASAITQDASPQGFIFTKEFTSSLPTADFAVSRVAWLDVVPAMGLSLINCPTSATVATECANPSSMGYPNSLLPLDIKAFAISPIAELAVISESSGSLRFAALPSQTSMPPPLAWAPLANQPIPTRKDKVLLAFGDLDGNSTWDLIVLHQDAQQDVSVYRQAGAQLVYDKPLSDSWQAALGNTPISALALGDLDSDGRADVAISRGSQVTVWINQNGMQPLSAWFAEVQKDVPVRALAIGQVDGAGPSDLVVASSTTPDAMGNATQYLHAYLGQ